MSGKRAVIWKVQANASSAILGGGLRAPDPRAGRPVTSSLSKRMPTAIGGFELLGLLNGVVVPASAIAPGVTPAAPSLMARPP
jgi:hypothetical protein